MTIPVSTDYRRKHRLVALVGNPNTGKTTLFNALTGYRQRVGNYPGVTVDKKTGYIRGKGNIPKIEIIDLPGAYSLAAHSVDEAVVLDVLLGRQDRGMTPDLILVVIDATHLARNLFLVSQLFEIGLPVVVALNMIDLAGSDGWKIDCETLTEDLGVPVIPVVAPKQIGVDQIIQTVINTIDAPTPRAPLSFSECVTAELEGLHRSLTKATCGTSWQISHIEVLQTLLDPGGHHETTLVRRCGGWLAEDLTRRRERILDSGESIVEAEARARYAWVDRVLARAVTRKASTRRSRSEAVDRVLTHRLAGLVALAILMGACFQSVYTWAAPIMDAVDRSFGFLGAALATRIPAGAIQSLLVDGVVAGVGAVLVFLPQILILFLFIAILEDCGYMARAAFLLDRWMRVLGLTGKSFIPLMCSFACAVPGIMATRTIEDRRTRFVTILVAPLMSCSARLPVYILLISAFIPAKPLLGGIIGLQAATLLAMYMIGILAAVVVTLLLRRTLIKGDPQSFLMELPGYKWPSPRTVLHRMYEQGKVFCTAAGTIIFAMTIMIWALAYYPRPAAIAADHDAQRVAVNAEYQAKLARLAAEASTTEEVAQKLQAHNAALANRLSEIDHAEAGAFLKQSILGRMGRWVEPVVEPLGWDWRIGTAAIASFPAREVVIATLSTIYNLGGEQDGTSASLRQKLHSAKWPDGRPVFNLAVALSLMVFFALCCQCGGTLAVIKRETKAWRWPLFTFSYMTALAYVGALVTYQIVSRLI